MSSPEPADAFPDPPNARIGYLELLRQNRDFRNLWLGQVVSELGDWFSTIAIFNLLLELTGRAQAVSWFLIVIHIPSGLLGPICGVLVDRWNRKRVMIATDLLRGALVLGYLAIHRADQAWLVYSIAALEVSLMTLFEPARTASIPNICARKELVAANALSGVTWSAMLTLGAAAGGFVTAILGRKVAFIVDAVSFALSAICIGRVQIRSRRSETEARAPGVDSGGSVEPAPGMPHGFRGLREGFRYVASHPSVLALLLVKTGWCLGGGLILILSVFGQTIFPVMGSGAAGIGILFASRGIGTAIGPIAARSLSGERPASMRSAIAWGFFLGAVFYVLFGQAPWLFLASAALMVAHMGGSITWVFSTVLLQLEVPDEYRGRVFALEFALLTLAIAVSNYFAGYGMDILALSPRTVAGLVGLYFFIPGILWVSVQRFFPKG